MRVSYLKKRYPMVWDEVYHGVRADYVQAAHPKKWDEKELERIAHNAAATAVCVHHKQWPVSARNYPRQASQRK